MYYYYIISERNLKLNLNCLSFGFEYLKNIKQVDCTDPKLTQYEIIKIKIKNLMVNCECQLISACDFNKT